MAHTSEHLAVLGNIEQYYDTRAKKGGGGASNLLEQLKRFFCLGILFGCLRMIESQGRQGKLT
jgi:hypothetical protein